MDSLKRRRVDGSGKAVAVTGGAGDGVGGAGSVPVGAVAENRLYVGNLERRVTEFHILKVFKKFGEVKDLEMGYHRDGPRKGEMKGSCFVEYLRRADAEAAKRATHGKKLLGRPIVVRFVEERVVSNVAGHGGGGGGGGGGGAGGVGGKNPSSTAIVPGDREYDPDGRRAAAAAAAATAADSAAASNEQLEAVYTAKIKQIRKRLAQLKRSRGD